MVEVTPQICGLICRPERRNHDHRGRRLGGGGGEGGPGGQDVAHLHGRGRLAGAPRGQGGALCNMIAIGGALCYMIALGGRYVT